ncbi:MAG: HAMP domain-containing sensor histidine kinase [Polyangiales bacterium]
MPVATLLGRNTRVTRKLVLAVLAVTLLVGAVNAALHVRREQQVFTDDMVRDHHFIGRTLLGAWRGVYRASGAAAADAMVREADERFPEIDVKIVPVDAPAARCLSLARGGECSRLQRRRFVSVFSAPEAAFGPRALLVSESTEPLERYFLGSLARNSAISLLVMLVTTALITSFGERFVGRPVRALREKARRVGGGDLSGPLHLRDDDELSELAEEINRMCERLDVAQRAAAAQHAAHIETIEQLRHADRLRTVGVLASGLAHELGTPLSVVLARAGLLAEGPLAAEEVAESARVIADQTRKMTAMIRQLLGFARRKATEKARVDLSEVISQGAALVSPVARGARSRVEVTTAGECWARVDAEQVQQVLMNLVMNAIQAMPGGGLVRVGVSEVERDAPADVASGARRWCRVTVDDEGTGVAPEHRAQVFDPFFTTKDVGEGTGLGLSVSYSIAREHGGWIELEPRAPRGTRFSLFVPADSA